MEVIFLYYFFPNVTEFYLGNSGHLSDVMRQKLARLMLIKCVTGVEMTLLKNILMRRSVVVLVPTSLGAPWLLGCG